MIVLFHFKTLKNDKGEFESFGELPSKCKTGIENRTSPLNCVSRKHFFGRLENKFVFEE